MKKWDATAIGEVLIDFTPAGAGAQGNPAYEANPGGAPANVLAALAKWGRKTAFIGKVGDDTFGASLRRTLENCGIDVRGLAVSGEARTTLAFVHLAPDGDRSFTFYRQPGADMLLTEAEVPAELAEGSRVFHFGSVSMTHEPSRSATLAAAARAREAGALVSYDPNLRERLWGSLDEAREWIRRGLRLAHALKLSEEELVFLTGETDLRSGTERLFREFGTRLIVVTLGPNGCYFRLGEADGRVEGYPVKAVDTTGAGDSFWAGLLFGLLGHLDAGGTLDTLTEEDVRRMAAFANAAGALTTTAPGAIPALPELEKVRELAGERR
ncbi:PfkB family carbohydrate kinase [Paenibacillus thermoaerophilus]|uniref:PfkB family carbohydrate kinase n=1 Tax=Paenibacillus thermoaerophilus TaxID=1215385 RepID=A0ABW2V752_9BACL|nr:PfkB family carbohydrate kinase [Paenibacillus thermoaerophilus]TMV13931.1 carbohydrate kinase [Paenibacillus thermoaerophilus]